MNEDKKFQMDQTAQAIADEMISSARAQRQAKESAKRLVKILKIVAFLIVAIMVYNIVSPFLSGTGARDAARKKTVSAVIDEINNYKTSHRNNLPMESSRRQWQRELIDKYIIGKDFNIEPSSQNEYRYEVNYKKTSAELIKTGDYQTIYIDQSSKCATGGELESAGSSVAAVRILLESGQLHCADNN